MTLGPVDVEALPNPLVDPVIEPEAFAELDVLNVPEFVWLGYWELVLAVEELLGTVD